MNRAETQFSSKESFSAPPAWPFFVADGILVFLAAGLIHFSEAGNRPVAMATALLALGALVFLAPYLLQWYAAHRREEARRWMSLRGKEDHGGGAEIREAVKQMEVLLQALTERIEKAEAFAEAMEKTVGSLGRLEAQKKAGDEAVGKKLDDFIRERREADAKLLEKEADASHSERLADGEGAVKGKKRRKAAPSVGAGESPQASAGSGQVTASSSVAGEIVDADKNREAASVKDLEEPAAESTAGKRKAPIVKELGDGLFSTTTLLATAFIGAGNELFVRGEGPGLTWEAGAPMQFLEKGRWGWTTAEAEIPIRLRIYKNDAEEDKAGEYTLEPGKSLEIRPEF